MTAEADAGLRGRRPTRSAATRAAFLTALLTGAGVSHLLVPQVYDAIVPRVLPGTARAWTVASGLTELACAAAVAMPSTRRRGAAAAFVLFVAVFPANVQMALDWRDDGPARRAVAYVRLPLQIGLLALAAQVRRDGWRGLRSGRAG